MLRELLAAGIFLLVGYVAGVFFGYRAAVTDYVENDAEQIESMAEDIYPTRTAEGEQRTVPDEVGAVLEEVKEDEEDDDAGTKAFH